MAVGCDKRESPREEVPAKPIVTSLAPPEPVVTSLADDPWASSHGPPVSPASPAAASLAPAGALLAEREPRLLAPIELVGFKLWSASVHQACCGVSARYVEPGDASKRLVARVSVRKSPGETLPDLDKTHRPVTIGGHEAVIYDLRDEANTTVIWFAGTWQHVVSVDFERARDRAAAREAAKRIAPAVAAHADRYLRDAQAPTADEQRVHLAAIIAASEAARQQEEADRLEQGPKQFVAKLERAGVTNDIVVTVGRGSLDADQLVITVGSSWHVSPKQERLMAAQNMWKVWASINSPTDLDKSRIKLVDANGNEVGGSGVVAGSRITVQD